MEILPRDFYDRDTLIVALCSTPVSGVLGMLIAFLVVRTSFPGKGLLEFTSILNFAVPGTVIGIGYILAFNRPPLLLIGTLAILVLNFVFRYIPVGIQSGIAVLRQIDPSIEEAAQNLGADCLAGSWAASVFLENRPDTGTLTLSPGDLDEAVKALLVFSSSSSDENPDQGAGFERVDAFRKGVMGGVEACFG